MRAFIGVGSNVGDREANIKKAFRVLELSSGVRLIKSSGVYETDPVGGPPQGKYLNAVWELETELSPRRLMNLLLEIETRLGRTRRFRNEPRIMDLDLIGFGDGAGEEDGVQYPHPRMHERYFVLKPMNDIAADWIHPLLGCTVRQLLEKLGERN